MNEHESHLRRPQSGERIDPVRDLDGEEISLRPLIQSLWSYRRVIGGLVAAIMTIFVAAALAAYVGAPAERLGTLGFRLLFDGASEGRYPNDTPFSSAEISATPVLTEVFDANELNRFGSYEDLQGSIFILQSNPELDLLSYEYQTRLADSRLTPVDRARVEDEFQRKRESLTDPRFTLNMRRDDRVVTMPPSLVNKVLDDTLATWARQAAERKGALLYEIPVLSKNILTREGTEREDTLIAVIVLRTQVMRILENIEEISTLPGAALIRVGRDRGSLPEARVELEDLLRFELQPLLGLANVGGLFEEPGLGELYIRDQIFHHCCPKQDRLSLVTR